MKKEESKRKIGKEDEEKKKMKKVDRTKEENAERR